MSDNKETLLKQIWDDTLSTMPRGDVESLLKKIGFGMSTSNLDDMGIRKVLYGLLTRLDEKTLQGALPLFQTT